MKFPKQWGVSRRRKKDPGESENDFLSRVRELPVAEFDSADEVEARIRRMNYGAKTEHRPRWMSIEEWEERNSV